VIGDWPQGDALPEEDSGRLVVRHADGDGAAAVRGLVLPVLEWQVPISRSGSQQPDPVPDR